MASLVVCGQALAQDRGTGWAALLLPSRCPSSGCQAVPVGPAKRQGTMTAGGSSGCHGGEGREGIRVSGSVARGWDGHARALEISVGATAIVVCLAGFSYSPSGRLKHINGGSEYLRLGWQSSCASASRLRQPCFHFVRHGVGLLFCQAVHGCCLAVMRWRSGTGLVDAVVLNGMGSLEGLQGSGSHCAPPDGKSSPRHP